MKRYVIYESSDEIKDIRSYSDGSRLANYLYDGCTYPDEEPIKKEVFDSKEKALVELNKYLGQAMFYNDNNLALVTEYYLDEEEYDEQEDSIDYAEIIEFAPNDFHRDIIRADMFEAVDNPEYKLCFPVWVNDIDTSTRQMIYAVIYNNYDYGNNKNDIVLFATDKNVSELRYYSNTNFCIIPDAYPEVKIAEQHLSHIDDEFDVWKFEDDIKEYLITKNIAEKIYSNQSAYQITAYKGHIYISAYDTFDNKEEFIKAIKECELPNGEFDNRYGLTIYDDYKELVADEYQQVIEDIQDVGLTENGQWNFYLTRGELEYMSVPADYIDKELQVENEIDYEME